MLRVGVAAAVIALLPAAESFCLPAPAQHVAQCRACLPSLRAGLRDLPAVVVADATFPPVGDVRHLIFSDKSEKRALKQVWMWSCVRSGDPICVPAHCLTRAQAVKGGDHGRGREFGRLALIQFDEAALASRRMELGTPGARQCLPARDMHSACTWPSCAERARRNEQTRVPVQQQRALRCKSCRARR